MFSRAMAETALEFMTGLSLSLTEPATAYLALFTTAPTLDDGTSAVEVSGGAYARVAITAAMGAPTTGADPTTQQNTAVISFPQATASWGTVVAVGIYNAATGGSLIGWDWLGNYPWEPCTISAATPAIGTRGQTAWSNGTSVVLDTTARLGGTDPTWTAAPAANAILTITNTSGLTFQLLNGTPTLATSSAGALMIRQVVSQSVPSGVTPQFAIDALTLSAV